MAIEQKDLTQEMINASITPLKTNDGYRTMCKAHCLGAENLQSAVNYLSDCLDIDKTNGVWLDYIGWLVGTTREYFDMSRYFCANSADINVEKEFYFPKSSQCAKSRLQDVFFRQKIKAKVGYNISKGNRNNNLSIIKGITNTEKVVITHEKEYNSTPFSVIGAPAISSNGIANGFGKGNAVKTTINKTPIKNIKIKARFLWNSTNTSKDGICVPYVLSFNRYRIDIKSTGIYGTSDLDASVGNRFDITFDEELDNNAIIDIVDEIGTNYRDFKATINGKIYTKHVDFAEAQDWSVINSLVLGNASIDGTSDYFWCGTIDLKENKVFVDDSLVYNGSKTIAMTLNVHLYGDDIVYGSINSLRNDIENIFGVTVGLNSLEIN